MPKTKKRGQPEYNRNFDIGDLVSVNGYGDTVYRVDGYREIHEENCGEDPMYYAEYTLLPIDNPSDWDHAYDEDMSLLAKAADAEKFLRNRSAREKRRRKGGQKILTVDDLLDDLRSYTQLRESLVSGPMREEVDELIATVKVALKKKTGGGRNA